MQLDINEEQFIKSGRAKIFNLALEELGHEKVQEAIRYLKSDEADECIKSIINDQIQNFGDKVSSQVIITSILYGIYIAVKNDIRKEE